MNDVYFEEARTWDHDLYRELERSRRRAWMVAAAGAGAAGLALLALVLVLPLKETVPLLITKDAETGYAEVARVVDGSLTQDEALSEFNVVRYVTARETYDPAALQGNYNLVYATSSLDVWEPYAPLFRRGTAGNLLELYGRTGSVRVTIKSVSFPAPDQAFVRFKTTRRTGSQEATEHWATTMKFRYAPAPEDLRTRAVNPLGFEVVSYRRDQEVVDGNS